MSINTRTKFKYIKKNVMNIKKNGNIGFSKVIINISHLEYPMLKLRND